MTRPGPAMGTEDEATFNRLVAYLIDFGLLSAVAFALGVVVWLVGSVVLQYVAAVAIRRNADFLAQAAASFVSGVLWVAVGVVVFAYFALLDGATGGTPGKRVMNVVVVNDDGSPVGMRGAVARTTVLMLPFPIMLLVATFLGGFGYLLALFLMGVWLLVEAGVLATSDDRRRLGDRLAGTVVVGRADEGADATRESTAATPTE